MRIHGIGVALKDGKAKLTLKYHDNQIYVGVYYLQRTRPLQTLIGSQDALLLTISHLISGWLDTRNYNWNVLV
jgi:hypothetical protein